MQNKLNARWKITFKTNNELKNEKTVKLNIACDVQRCAEKERFKS